MRDQSPRPVIRRKSQPSPVHFFAKPLGILLHAVTSKAIASTGPIIQFNLPPNVLIKCQKTFVFRLQKIHHTNLAAEREAYLNDLIFSESIPRQRLQERGAAMRRSRHKSSVLPLSALQHIQVSSGNLQVVSGHSVHPMTGDQEDRCRCLLTSGHGYE